MSSSCRSTLTAFRKKEIAVDTIRFLEALTIGLPALPKATLLKIRQESPQYALKKGDPIEDSSPISSVLGEFITPLRGDEAWIDNATCEQRLNQRVFLGYQHAMWLVENQDKFPLVWEAFRGSRIDNIQFRGTAVKLSGWPHAPYLLIPFRPSRVRLGGWTWIGNGLTHHTWVAVAEQ